MPSLSSDSPSLSPADLAPAALDKARRISIAPMMDWTDRHDRYFLRQISQHCLLYTEMVSTGALLHGDRQRFLGFNDAEHPIALQVGGNQPNELAQCAALAQDWGYDEININVGCPSDRVQAARFGACLMAEPGLVAEGVRAMRNSCDIPVTVKTRIGIDEQDGYDFVRRFIETVAAAGCGVFIVHARKAWLSGLSPKQNREIPPLRYDVVAQLKADFPELLFVLNGGITDLVMAAQQLQTFDGVMLGRAAYQNPYLLAAVDQRFYDVDSTPLSREAILVRMIPYIRAELGSGVPLKCITRHMLGLFQGQPGAKAWRRTLSELGPKEGAGLEVLYQALRHVLDDADSDRLLAA